MRSISTAYHNRCARTAAADDEPSASSPSPSHRPCAKGKFLFVGEEKLLVRGVSYGPFAAETDGCEYHTSSVVDGDFQQIAALGANTVRTYTVPPRWLLDLAQRHGLRVMVGLPWEQHIAFLDGRRQVRDIERRVRQGVRACAGHPAVLCYAIGNEIPAPIVRWHGHRRVERFLERLYRAAKAEDPQSLVTYVNYPSTEYLDLPFADLVAFNIYLEQRASLEAYLARLQNLAGDRPLVVAEVGLDGRRHGEAAQAEMMAWQLGAIYEGGCAGAVVFSWTDEWSRGGCDIRDWEFGLSDRQRRPKPALAAVGRAFAQAPFPQRPWPRVSVIVCTYNGSRTIRQCLEGLSRLDYPDYEVIVVNDGSTDGTAAIAGEYDVRLISTTNQGLSQARNTGLRAATGEIVAYIDDDAYADPHWLMYLADTFLKTDHAGVGGPNIAPACGGTVADCVARAPGGPIHVLLTDRVAEHIPGCNMAFRRERLAAIGGFDPRFRIAGDDVDVCWRLQERGWTLGFSPAAVVWHQRRNSVRAYWRQQVNYGRAEADLERKWPAKYNSAGHLTWAGRIYCRSYLSGFGWLSRQRIYHGTWGNAPFQIGFYPPPGILRSLPRMPEWHLLLAVLAVATGLGAIWPAMLLSLPLLLAALGVTVGQALHSVPRSWLLNDPQLRPRHWRLFGLTAALHLMQPIARLWGRLGAGLTPWRRRARGFAAPWTRTHVAWSERWLSRDQRLELLEAELRSRRLVVHRGGDYDGWDLEVRGGILGAAQLTSVVEEHGQGRQLVRLRVAPQAACAAPLLTGCLAGVAVVDGYLHLWTAAAVAGLLALLLTLRVLQECAGVMAAVRRAFRSVPATIEAAHNAPAPGANSGADGQSIATSESTTPDLGTDSGAPEDLGLASDVTLAGDPRR